jgi:hypothetical protein
MISDDDRTTPLGLFYYARTYRQSGVALHRAKVKATHPDAPVVFLLAHAIELYLNAFLRGQGLAVDELRGKFVHDPKKLASKFSVGGLPLDEEDDEVLKLLKEDNSLISSRYIVTASTGGRNAKSSTKGEVMKVVVIGGTGLIGSKVVSKLTQLGHEALAAAPNTGVNTITGEGLAEALEGAQVVVDMANSPSFEDQATMDSRPREKI